MQLAQITNSDLRTIENFIGLKVKNIQGNLVSIATIGDIANAIIPYIFVISGISLLLYLLYGGLTMMLSRGEPKAFEEAKAKITNAAIGFVIIFASYWIWQLAKLLLGII